MAEPRSVAIEVVSDVICPWCFIGKRRLEKALALLEPELAARVTWLAITSTRSKSANSIR